MKGVKGGVYKRGQVAHLGSFDMARTVILLSLLGAWSVASAIKSTEVKFDGSTEHPERPLERFASPTDLREHPELGNTRFAVMPSTIDGAGLGAFARKALKKGYRARYRCRCVGVRHIDE